MKACGCADVGPHLTACSLRKEVICSNCGQPGHTARRCGIAMEVVRIVIPVKMLADIDKVAATLERPTRKYAITRLLVEALCHREV